MRHQDRTSGHFTLTFLRWMKAFKCGWFWKVHHIILFERELDQLKFEGCGLCFVFFPSLFALIILISPGIDWVNSCFGVWIFATDVQFFFVLFFF